MAPKFRAFKMIPGDLIPEDMHEYYSLPVEQLPELVIEYVAAMEIQRTNEWCKCQWLIHPEDVDLDIHNCRTCHHPRALHTEMEGMEGCTKQDDEAPDTVECQCEGWVDPPKRRLRRGDTHALCPVHTKEGFLLHFFEWVFKTWDDVVEDVVNKL